MFFGYFLAFSCLFRVRRGKKRPRRNHNSRFFPRGLGHQIKKKSIFPIWSKMLETRFFRCFYASPWSFRLYKHRKFHIVAQITIISIFPPGAWGTKSKKNRFFQHDPEWSKLFFRCFYASLCIFTLCKRTKFPYHADERVITGQ